MTPTTLEQVRAHSDAPLHVTLPEATPEAQAMQHIISALDTVMMEAFGGQSVKAQRFLANKIRSALEFLENAPLNRITRGVAEHYRGN